MRIIRILVKVQRILQRPNKTKNKWSVRALKREKHNRLLWLALLGFALRAVIPAGYMPAALADGLPFVACPDGFYGEAFTVFGNGNTGHAHESGRSDDGGHDSLVRDFCAFGVLLGASVVTAGSDPLTLAPRYDPPPISPEAVMQPSTVRTNRARAPPTDPTIDA